MVLRNHALYQVTLKVIIKNKDKILLLVTPDEYFDFPGGRVDQSEVDIPFIESIKREVAEECGKNLKFQVLEPAFIAKRQYTSAGQDHLVLAIYYEALYIGGQPELSDEHSLSNWVKPSELIDSPDKFVSKDEFEQFKKYFSLAS